VLCCVFGVADETDSDLQLHTRRPAVWQLFPHSGNIDAKADGLLPRLSDGRSML
jgi:hypothetical protein